MTKVLLLMALLVGSTQVFGQFCLEGRRLTPENYLRHYHSIRRQLVDMVKHDSVDMIDALSTRNDLDHSEELCAHNQFLFTDFILYFELEHKFSKYSALSDYAFKQKLLRQRDSLYAHWMSTIAYRSKTGYYEWEQADLMGESLENFWGRGSDRFAWLEDLVRRFNSAPHKRRRARRLVYDYLGARTPFSSIMSVEAIKFAQADSSGDLVECVLGEVATQGHLWEATLLCANNDPERALMVLGALSAQRMYLIRDYKAWMDQNTDSTEFNALFHVLSQSSVLYFKIETEAFRQGSARNYPPTILGESPKSYHFYTTALLAYQLAKAGHEKELSIREAVRPAKKYKRAIRWPGLAHNIWLRNRLNASTVGDYRQVTREQKLGAEWGWELFNIPASGAADTSP